VKGHAALLDAFAALRRQTTQCLELRLIGDGPMRESLEQRARALELGSSVRFLGTRDDLPHQLRELDLFVLASDREGRPTSIMEAMSAGLPVIATNVGAVRDLVIDGETGFLAESAGPIQLARAMAALIEHDELRRKMATAARDRAVREFSLERMGREYAAFYNSLVSRQPMREAKATTRPTA